MRVASRKLYLVLVATVLLPAILLVAQQRSGKSVPRAKHPNFDSTTTNLFFPDVFAEGGPLFGSRPANVSAAPTAVASAGGGNDGGNASAGGVFAWGKIISAATIEDEVKAIKMQLDKDITQPSKFTSGGNRACRTHFSMLAMLFAIVGEYDGDVRWKESGPAARDLFARTAGNCKTNTRTVFDESRKRKEELQDLIGGAGLNAKAGEAAADWSQVADRSPLMKRIDVIMNENLQPWTANANDFKTHADEIVHQAEIIAAVGEVLTKEGMEDAGDEDYDGFSIRMRDAARQIVDAVKLKNEDNARKAVGEIMKACSECHESYRG